MPGFMRRYRRTPVYKNYMRNRRRINRKVRRPMLRRKNATTSIQRNVFVADRLFVPLKWTLTAQSLTSVTTAADQDFYILNSPVNPLPTSSQDAFGFNQWSAFYRQYICFGSSINIRFSNLSGSVPARCSITPVTENVLGTTSDVSQVGAPYSRYKTAGVISGSNSVITLRNKCSVKRVGGLTRIGAQDGEYCGQTNFAGAGTGSTPTEQFYWAVSANTVNNSINTLNIAYDVVITYFVQFFDRINVGTST